MDPVPHFPPLYGLSWVYGTKRVYSCQQLLSFFYFFILQGGGHLVDIIGELPELVVLSQRQLHVKITFPDALQSLINFRQRARDAVRKNNRSPENKRNRGEQADKRPEIHRLKNHDQPRLRIHGGQL